MDKSLRLRTGIHSIEEVLQVFCGKMVQNVFIELELRGR